MKKVFISMPMKDRKKEDIEKSFEKVKKTAKVLLGEDIEFINTVVEEKPPYNSKDEAVWYLGKSIELLSQADVLIVPGNYSEYKGCSIEVEVAFRYEIEIIKLHSRYICPDLFIRKI